MSSTPAGILNYDKMEDKDKAYLLKLLASIGLSLISGIITGISFDEGANIWWLGFLLFFGVQAGSIPILKSRFDLKEMTDMQIFRHGIFVGLLMYIFFWTVIFDFLILF
jgi:hypothetical protein